MKRILAGIGAALDVDALALLDQWQQVVRHRLERIDFAVLQGIHGGLWIGNRRPWAPTTGAREVARRG